MEKPIKGLSAPVKAVVIPGGLSLVTAERTYTIGAQLLNTGMFFVYPTERKIWQLLKMSNSL